MPSLNWNWLSAQYWHSLKSDFQHLFECRCSFIEGATVFHGYMYKFEGLTCSIFCMLVASSVQDLNCVNNVAVFGVG